MKELKISEILHLAADKYLSATKDRQQWFVNKEYESWFSCCAVEAAIYQYVRQETEDCYLKTSDCVFQGLESMGCNTGSFRLFEKSSDPQGDRYMWLKFAAIIAEEQEAAGYKLEI